MINVQTNSSSIDNSSIINDKNMYNSNSNNNNNNSEPDRGRLAQLRFPNGRVPGHPLEYDIVYYIIL